MPSGRAAQSATSVSRLTVRCEPSRNVTVTTGNGMTGGLLESRERDHARHVPAARVLDDADRVPARLGLEPSNPSPDGPAAVRHEGHPAAAAADGRAPGPGRA